MNIKKTQLSENDVADLSVDISNAEESEHSILSNCSNWTKGRSRQRLRVPSSLKDSNQISIAVKEKNE